MRSSLALVLTVLVVLLVGSGCAGSNPARQASARPTEASSPAPPTTTAPAPPLPMAPMPAPAPRPMAVSTPVVRPTPVRTAPPAWQTTDRGSRTLRITPIGAVAVETVPPPPPAPASATAGDLGAPPTGSLPTPLPR